MSCVLCKHTLGLNNGTFLTRVKHDSICQNVSGYIKYVYLHVYIFPIWDQ